MIVKIREKKTGEYRLTRNKAVTRIAAKKKFGIGANNDMMLEFHSSFMGIIVRRELEWTKYWSNIFTDKICKTQHFVLMMFVNVIKPPTCCFFLEYTYRIYFTLRKNRFSTKAFYFFTALIRFYSVELFRSDPTNPASASIPGLIQRTFEAFFHRSCTTPITFRSYVAAKNILCSIILIGSHTLKAHHNTVIVLARTTRFLHNYTVDFCST